MTETWSNDELFRWFVLQQQQMVMIHLGKLVHPATSKIERDLEAAKLSIDLLGMLESKSKGNLLPEDDRLIGQVLATLRLNFVEEATRSPEKSDDSPTEADASTDEPPERGGNQPLDSGA
jgi:hypothetical protein